MPPYSGLSSVSGMFSTPSSSSPSKSTPTTTTTTTTTTSSSTKISPSGQTDAARTQHLDLMSSPSRGGSTGKSSSSKYQSYSSTTKSAIECNKNSAKSSSNNRERHHSSSSERSEKKYANNNSDSGSLKRTSSLSKHELYDPTAISSVLSSKIDSNKDGGAKDSSNPLNAPILDPTSLLINNPSAFPGLFPMDPLTNTASPFYFPFGVGSGLPGLSDPRLPYSTPTLFSASSTTATATYTTPVFSSVSTTKPVGTSSHDSKESLSSLSELSRHSNGRVSASDKLKEMNEYGKSKADAKERRSLTTPVSSIARSDTPVKHRNRSPVVSPPPLGLSKVSVTAGDRTSSPSLLSPLSKTNVTASNRTARMSSSPGFSSSANPSAAIIPAAHSAKTNASKVSLSDEWF